MNSKQIFEIETTAKNLLAFLGEPATLEQLQAEADASAEMVEAWFNGDLETLSSDPT